MLTPNAVWIVFFTLAKLRTLPRVTCLRGTSRGKMATAPSWTLWLLMCRVADGMIAQEAAAAATTFGYKLEINRGNAMGVGSPPLWPRCGHSCGQIEVASNAYDCARLVKSKDTSPKRSPQVVHTLLAWCFQGRTSWRVGRVLVMGLIAGCAEPTAPWEWRLI